MSVLVDGRRLDTRVIGGDGLGSPRLVFLHEGLGSIELWRSFPEDVCRATGLPGLVYSRLGHGWSDPAVGPRGRDYLHIEALDVLPEVLDSFGIHAPVLIGHSDGASIALIHAGAGHSVSGLILLAPHVFVEVEALVGIEAAKSRYALSDLSDRMRKYHHDPDAIFRAWSDIWLDPDFGSWTIEAELPDIYVPTLVIQGADDEYGTSAHLDRIAASVSGPVQTHELTDCGHSPHLSQPEQTKRAVVDFISELG